MDLATGIDVRGSTNKRALARIGYFHGYNGYRFSGVPSRTIPYAEFDDLLAVIEFDSGVMALLYPFLTKLEMAMTNLALVELLDVVVSSELSDVYTRLMHDIRRDGRRGKMGVIHAGSQILLERQKRGDRIVAHYYDRPGEAVPLWALIEVMTLRHFGRFLEQLSPEALLRVASSWGVQRRDADLTLDSPSCCGGWEEVWRSLEMIEFFDLDAVVEYAVRLDSAITFARVGFFLEQHRDELMVDDEHLMELLRMKPRQPRYVDSDRRRGRLVHDWNLIVPDEIAHRRWEEST
jgi:hypothetical protein